MVLPQETKVSRQRLEEILKFLKPKYEEVAIDSRGNSGNIPILWNTTNIMVEGWIRLPCIITDRFRKIGMNDWILISSVYGPHIPREKETFLESIGMLKNLHNEKCWLIGGDFNMIKSLEEKK